MSRAIICGLAMLLFWPFTDPSACAATSTPDQLQAVPGAPASVLASLGFAAIIAAEKRRRKLSRIKQGADAFYFLVKRLIDIALASALLLAAAPLMLIIALLVRFDSPGPIFHRRRVIGRHGKGFDMFKFRSMVTNADEILERDEELRKVYSQNFKLDADPRVTRVGSLLRKTSLDELPQLLNVLLGSMTFVGPRPIHSDEVLLYGPEVERFKMVKPGITGLWQTSGRSETSYERRVEMDMLYIERRCTAMDIAIILRTIPAVLTRRGAC